MFEIDNRKIVVTFAVTSLVWRGKDFVHIYLLSFLVNRTRSVFYQGPSWCDLTSRDLRVGVTWRVTRYGPSLLVSFSDRTFLMAVMGYRVPILSTHLRCDQISFYVLTSVVPGAVDTRSPRNKSVGSFSLFRLRTKWHLNVKRNLKVTYHWPWIRQTFTIYLFLTLFRLFPLPCSLPLPLPSVLPVPLPPSVFYI